MTAGYAISASFQDYEASESLHPLKPLKAIKMENSRPKSMRRRISVGLPLHNRHREIPHTAHGENHSRLTQYLLQTFQHRPLLHSILVEKDSRRIFYFMWYVSSTRTCNQGYAETRLLVSTSHSCLYNSSMALLQVLWDCLATAFTCSLIAWRLLWASAQLS